MKKFFALTLTLLLTLSLAACGASGNAGSSGDAGEPEAPAIASPLELLTTVWDSYGDDEKFPATGGDFSEDGTPAEGPGTFGLEDPAMLDSLLGLPADSADQIDDAASLMHMMNGNTFTAGAFHVADSENVSSVADALKESILNRQWMCGFPDKLVVITVGDYVVSAFGSEDVINLLRDKTLSAYDSAVLTYEEPLA